MALGIASSIAHSGAETLSLGEPLSNYYTPGGSLAPIQTWLDSAEVLHQDVEIQGGATINSFILPGTTKINSTAPVTMGAGVLQFTTTLNARFRSDLTPWASAITKGDTTFTCPNVTGISVGNMMVITDTSAGWQTQWSYGKSYCGIITSIDGNNVTCNKTAMFNWDATEANLTVDFWDVAQLDWTNLDLDGASGTAAMKVFHSKCNFLGVDISLPGDDVVSVDGIFFTNCYESLVTGEIDGGRYPVTYSNGYSNTARGIKAGYGALTRHPVDLTVAERDTIFDDWDIGGNISSPAPAHPCVDATVKRMNGSCIGFSPRSMGLVMEDCTIDVAGTGADLWQSLVLVPASGADYNEHPMTLTNVAITYSSQNYTITGADDQDVTITECRLPSVANKSTWTPSAAGSLTVNNSTVGAFVGYGGITATGVTFDPSISELFDASALDAVFDANGNHEGAVSLTNCTVVSDGSLAVFQYIFGSVSSTGTTFKDAPDFSTNGNQLLVPDELHTSCTLDNIGAFTNAPSQPEWDAVFPSAVLLNGTTRPS